MTSEQVLFTPVRRSLAHSSLGFHAAWAGLAPVERACLPEATGPSRVRSIESSRTLGEFQVLWTSVAWELEMQDLVEGFRDAGIEPVAVDRPGNQPLVIAGGPLTLSNPELLGAVADAVFLGEADLAFRELREAVDRARDREDAMARLAAVPGVWVPATGGPPGMPVHADPPDSPLRSRIPEEENEFGGAFLVEVGRGCPRFCTFCVARGGGGGARFVPGLRILDAIPTDASQVGLLGAAVSDHPDLLMLVRALRARGTRVTLGSLRADRVGEELVSLLAAAGLRTLTVAADGPSERLRRSLRKGVREAHLRTCGDLAARYGLMRLKVYAMVGLPGEEDADLEELAGLARSLAERTPVTLSVSPFVPKRFTPLSGAPFAGVETLRRRSALLSRRLGGRVRLRITSPREAEREWRWSHLGLGEAQEEFRRLAARASGHRATSGGGQSRFRRARSSSSRPK